MKKRFLSLVMALCMLVCAVPSFASGTESIGPWIADLEELAEKSVEYNNTTGTACESANCYINIGKYNNTYPEIEYDSAGDYIVPNGRDLNLSFGQDFQKCQENFTFGFKINTGSSTSQTSIQFNYLSADSDGKLHASAVGGSIVGNYLIRYTNSRLRATNSFVFNNDEHYSKARVDTSVSTQSWHDLRFCVEFPIGDEDTNAFYVSTYIDGVLKAERAPVPKKATVDDIEHTIKGIYYVILRSSTTSKYKDIYMYPGISSANVASDLSGDKAEVTDIKIYQGNSFISANGSYNKNEALKISALLSNEDTSATMPCTLMLAEYTSDNQLLQLIPVSKELSKATSTASYTDILGTSLIPSADSHHIKVFVMDSQNTIIPLSQSVYLTASTN